MDGQRGQSVKAMERDNYLKQYDQILTLSAVLFDRSKSKQFGAWSESATSSKAGISIDGLKFDSKCHCLRFNGFHGVFVQPASANSWFRSIAFP